MTESDTKIISFNCWKWGYGAADMAGTIRAQYPATIRPIRINCTGRVTPSLMMRAIAKGADGVLVSGWYPGECDYETGNLVAAKNIKYVKEILKTTGISPERIQMIHCTAAEGQKFQKEATEFDKTIRKLGPSPVRIKGGTPKKAKAKAKA